MNRVSIPSIGLLALGALGAFSVAGCGGRPEVAMDARNAAQIRERLEEGAAAGGGGEELAEPTGFATLTGRFTYGGAAPNPSPVGLTGEDAAKCVANGNPPLDDSLVVGSGGGLQNLLIYLDMSIPLEDPKWVHPDYAANAAAELTGREQGFDQENCMFLTHVFAMRSTQKLQLINSDPLGHNTNIAGGGKANPFNQIIGARSATVYEPDGASKQPFDVRCNIHPWMKAWMIVRDDPYFAVTKPDGSFEIKNVPAGVPLEFKVWHERMKAVETVSVNGAETKWKRGKLSLTLKPGESRQFDVVVSDANLR